MTNHSTYVSRNNRSGHYRYISHSWFFSESELKADKALHQKVSFSANGKYFGIPHPANTTIVPFTAMEESISGEAERYKFDRLTLKGTYISLLVKAFRKDLHQMKKLFKRFFPLGIRSERVFVWNSISMMTTLLNE